MIRLLFALILTPSLLFGGERPNIVFLLSEDNSHHYLDLFFEGGAKTPHIADLAEKGLVFENAFSNAPVCSVARTTLITSCYGPRIGTQFHRRYELAEMPEGLKMFPAYLRDAGYYTTNNSKKDYNAVEGTGVWDESSNKASWRDRKEQTQPFFHMQTFKESHEGSLHFSQDVYANQKTKHDPSGVTLPPYFPDTPLFRYTVARYLDRMVEIDELIGKTVAQLTEDGLLENTFIFYFGDHGGVLPRGKGYIYDSGLHIPLVVRVPEKFKHMVDADLGSRQKGLVSFIDFGPTALKLAGVQVPSQVDGKAFLGEGVKMDEVNGRESVFGYADRFDEKYEFLRSLRTKKYQYIRAYQNWLPDGLQNNYRYKMLAFQEWRKLSETGKLNEVQSAFHKAKPVELLFDTQADPHQVKNLANDPAHAEVLKSMRAKLHEKVSGISDLSFYPESHLISHAMKNPVAFGKEKSGEIARLVDVADLALLPFEEAKPKVEVALKSSNEFERMWAAMVCSSFGKEAKGFAPILTELSKSDASNIVRVRSAEFLGLSSSGDPMPTLLEIINTTQEPVLAMEALNSLVLFQDYHDAYRVEPKAVKPIAKFGNSKDLTWRLEYLNGVHNQPKKRKRGK